MKIWPSNEPEESGEADGFGMRFCEHLISHQLGLGWKYRIIGEDYKKQYGNNLCWLYPIMGDFWLGEYLILVREGVLSLPYTGFEDNDNAVLELDAAALLRLKPRGEIKRCPLLKDRKCSVHNAKPTVCALFPLGRGIACKKGSSSEVTIMEKPFEPQFRAHADELCQMIRELSGEGGK